MACDYKKSLHVCVCFIFKTPRMLCFIFVPICQMKYTSWSDLFLSHYILFAWRRVSSCLISGHNRVNCTFTWDHNRDNGKIKAALLRLQGFFLDSAKLLEKKVVFIFNKLEKIPREWFLSTSILPRYYFIPGSLLQLTEPWRALIAALVLEMRARQNEQVWLTAVALNNISCNDALPDPRCLLVIFSRSKHRFQLGATEACHMHDNKGLFTSTSENIILVYHPVLWSRDISATVTDTFHQSPSNSPKWAVSDRYLDRLLPYRT